MPRRSTAQLSYQHVFESGSDPDAAPLLLLHGTGGNEHDLLRLGRAHASHAPLLSPRGDVSEGGALRFFARLAEGVFDADEVRRRTHALADFIVAAGKHYGFEPLRLTAVGFSNGANIASTLLLLRPETLGGAILFRPMVVLEQPAAPGSLAGKRVLLAHGTTDPLVPPDHPGRLADFLLVGGAEVQLASIAASHQLTPQDFSAARTFLA